ncbi:MAG: PaaI family thioesterase [Actinomycetota bacterium]|jgi:acyl-coenzyme A thioesterase PaaI-like protein
MRGGNNDEELEARLAAASALWELADALVQHQCPATVLREIAGTAHRLTSTTAAHPVRSRAETLHRLIAADGGLRLGTFVERAVAGRANPTAAEVHFAKESSSSVTAEAYLRSAHEAAPGRAHGGVVAALFDDVMGAIPHLVGTPAFTTKLTVNFRAPTPAPGRIVLRAWLASREGNYLRVESEASHGDRLTATAEAMFRVVDAKRFLAS